MNKKTAAALSLAAAALMTLSSCSAGGGEAVVEGYSGSVGVQASVGPEGGFSLSLTTCSERAGLGSMAAELMVERINEAGSLSVDLISGATVTSSAVVAAAEQALRSQGLSDEDIFTNVSSRYEYRYEDSDVVIVGAGAAGLSAAIEAAESGARVIVVEKLGVPGGSLARSFGYIAAVSSDEQRYNYIDDSPTSFAASWLETAGLTSNQLRILNLSERSADNINFLKNSGARLSAALFSDSVDPSSPSRLHLLVDAQGNAGGGGAAAALVERARSLGVRIICDAKVYDICLDATGVVTGVRARVTGRGILTVNAPAVILATGGFDRNLDLVNELVGQKQWISFSSPGNTGDGLELALAVGGSLDGSFGEMLELYDFYGSTNGNPDGILVTSDGDRFVREDESGTAKAAALSARGGDMRAYYITDANGYSEAFEVGLANGTIYSSDSLEGLSELIGARLLPDTVHVYNRLCELGEPDYYGKSPDCMKPIAQAPFYAVPYELRSFGTTGGIATDIFCRVSSASRGVVDGLFAAGECANGAYFAEGYPGFGYSLSQAIDTGRTAAQSAVRFLRDNDKFPYDSATPAVDN